MESSVVDVSILITAYNYEKYISECIESCLNQVTTCHFEVIVIDDGSKDNTLKIAKNYRKDIRILAMENCGVEKAVNAGINAAKGNFIVRVDADDCLKPNFLHETFNVARASDASFVYSEYVEIDEDSRDVRFVSLPDFDQDEIRCRGDFLATGTLYKRQSIIEAGLYNEATYNCGLENYELILKLLNNGEKGHCIHSFLFHYRRHSQNMSNVRRDKIIAYGHSLCEKGLLNAFTTNPHHPYQLIV